MTESLAFDLELEQLDGYEFKVKFEDFCVVTESVRRGIPVGVRVVDAAGKPVFAA
jgi:hypothetical protein